EERKELGKEIFNMIVELEKRGERISNLIHDIGSLRLVTIAEKPSFEEIKRARDLTRRYIKLEGVHINMIIPQPKKCDFCEKIRSLQLDYTSEIEKEFKKLKIWQSEKLKEEPIGINGLRLLAREVYGENISADEILNPKV
ncbi:MAG: ArsA-related P-loop ATPase, partial [Promethearchaeota archaeon]